MSCFKTYDIRGRLGDELNVELAERIGRAYAQVTGARKVAVGQDMRLSSPELAQAVTQGLLASGVDVLELGLCGTEMVYFATFSAGLDGGIMVTASHNPADYNGMKLVGQGARPIGKSDLVRIEQSASRLSPPERPSRGKAQSLDWLGPYLEAMTATVPPDGLAGMTILANAGNGAIGPILPELARRYGLRLEVLHEKPDGTFPNGVPNPLLPENRAETSRAVVSRGAQLGVAWDGDFDRCFFFDQSGEFVESYYLVGLFAEHFLRRSPGAAILYDPRLTWNTEELVRSLGGRPLICRTGHVFFKEALRDRGAVYGGEMSGHHYFASFGCCDSGVVPFLTLLRLMADKAQPLGALVGERAQRYPISGEINREVSDQDACLARVRSFYQKDALAVSELDGISMEFERWRFNLRPSNTEPLIRLNVESRGDPQLVQEKVDEILDLLTDRR